jgi:phosphodiesterase/alkaline phosphatase D-like protein
LGRPNTFVARQPDLFVYLGDNIYGDTISMDDLRMKYAKLRHAQEKQVTSPER